MLNSGAPDATARHGELARIDNCHFPIFFMMRAVVFGASFYQIDSKIRVHGIIIKKEHFNHFRFETGANDEPLEPEPPVPAHDVPEHGSATDFNHRLWAKLSLLFQARTEAAGENEDGDFRVVHERLSPFRRQ